MPVVTIESPSGQSFQIEAPEGATDEQILRFAKSQGLFDQDAHGKQVEQEELTESPSKPIKSSGGRSGRGQQLQQQRLSEREEILSSLSPERRQLLESITPGEAALIGAGRGLMTIGRGLGLAAPEDQEITESYQQLEKLRPEAVVGEVAGQAAPFMLPGLGTTAIASTPLRAAAVAGLGASEGALISRGLGGGIGEQILSAGIGGTVAGALELGLPVIGRIGGKIIRRVTGRPPKGAVIDGAGNPSPELVSALERQGLTPQDVLEEAITELRGDVVDPDQVARAAFLRSQGVEPTRAQVTQLASDFMNQQELAKRTSKVRAALQRQDAALTTRFNNAILDTGGTPDMPTNTVVDSITDKATVLDNEISSLYDMARKSAPGEKNIRFEGLSNMLTRLAPQNRKGGYNIESIVGDLKTRGILDKKGKLVGKVDVNTAEDVRQAINELYDPANGFGNIQLRMLKDKLDDDVFKASGGDIFKRARTAKANFEQGLKRAKVSKFDSRKDNLVRDVLENKVNPDTFTKDVVFSKKWRAEDLTQLRDYLQADDAGKVAFNNLRADVMQEIKDRAFKGAADEMGFVPVTRDRLERAINAVGKEKLNVMFTPNEVKFLDDMVKVAKLREPVPGTFIGEGPSGAAINKQTSKLMKALDRLGVISDVIEGISINAQGRMVVKPRPDKLVRPIAGSQARQAAALGGAALSTQALGAE